jgi:hypothetical protein
LRLILSLLPAALPLCACQPADAPPTPARSAQTMPDAAPSSLVGQYRVAGIDGEEVGGGIGIALTVTEQLIWFDPRCAGFSWTYIYDDGALATDRPEKPREGKGQFLAGPVRPTCRIAVHPEQRRLANALDAVDRVRVTPSNAIELSGGDHSLVLFSQ